jgi:amino-acid N-acetyltransferase
VIRKARQDDVRFVHGLLAEYGKQGLLLARSLSSIYECLRDFQVAEDEEGNKTGCCALHISWENLAEVRSLAVSSERQGEGWGQRLVESCLSEALTLGFPKVFVLTYRPEFFTRWGFKEVEKHTFPNKIWADCIHCVSFPDCDEIAMLMEL